MYVNAHGPITHFDGFITLSILWSYKIIFLQKKKKNVDMVGGGVKLTSEHSYSIQTGQTL